jgi:hypothetical protein
MNEDELQLMCMIRDQYVDAGLPSYRAWFISLGSAPPATANGLVAGGYVAQLNHAHWELTAYGLQWIMDNRHLAKPLDTTADDAFAVSGLQEAERNGFRRGWDAAFNRLVRQAR